MALSPLRIAVPLLCSVLILGAGLGQPSTAPGGSSQEIEALTAQLGSPDEAVRTSAQEKLVSMGEAARGALEAQVRARAAAEAVLERIETGKIAGATLLTLKMTDAAPQAVFAEMARQTGYEVRPFDESFWEQGAGGLISVDAEKQPFWAVMRDVCSKSGVCVYNAGGAERAVQFMPPHRMGPDLMKHPACISGAFMVIITGLQRTAMIDMGNPRNVQHGLSMQMHVFVEPKVRVLQGSYRPELEEAVDEKGNSLIHAGVERSMGPMWGFPGMSPGISVPLQRPPGAGQKIARVRGKLRTVVQTRSETLEVPDLMNARDITKTVGGRRITVKEVKKIGERQYQANIVFYRDGRDGQQFHEMMNNVSMALLDDEGHEFMLGGMMGSSGGADQIEAKMTFHRRGAAEDAAGGVAEPTSLVWIVPTASREIGVPFEFSDLPLP